MRDVQVQTADGRIHQAASLVGTPREGWSCCGYIIYLRRHPPAFTDAPMYPRSGQLGCVVTTPRITCLACLAQGD